jgi:hypothetical protein
MAKILQFIKKFFNVTCETSVRKRSSDCILDFLIRGTRDADTRSLQIVIHQATSFAGKKEFQSKNVHGWKHA